MDKVPANKNACDLYLGPQYPLKACNLPFGYDLFIVLLKTDNDAISSWEAKDPSRSFSRYSTRHVYFWASLPFAR